MSTGMQQKPDKDANTIVFSKVAGSNKIRMAVTFTTYAEEEKNVTHGPRFTCSVPSFNMHFSASTQEEAWKRGKIMVDAFMSFWISKHKLRGLVIELQKCGFKAQAEGPAQWMNVKKLMAGMFETSSLSAPIKDRNRKAELVHADEGEYHLEDA